MRKLFPLLIVICLFTAGCPAIPSLFSPSASGSQQAQQLQTTTTVHLYGENYRVIKTNITGTSWGFSLLGFVTLKSPNYIKAVEQMYKEAGIDKEKSQAIVNVAQQDTAPYFILFSLPRITLRADLIEFTGGLPATSPVPTPPTAPLSPHPTAPTGTVPPPPAGKPSR
ncbi:MAG TPA: DUF6567 family protein [Geomonas sp.]|nr:DUF6567 family protein [Geomonas sp.]